MNWSPTFTTQKFIIFQISSKCESELNPSNVEQSQPNVVTASDFKHTRYCCLWAPKSIKCVADNASDKCQFLRMDPCIYANCSGSHPAIYHSCKQFQKLHTTVDEIRRREADPSSICSASTVSIYIIYRNHPTFENFNYYSNYTNSLPKTETLIIPTTLWTQLVQLTSCLEHIESRIASEDWKPV